MDRISKSLISGSDGHPNEDDLLLFMDGELNSRASIQMRNHLAACWSCRVRSEKIEETISTFIDYRNHVLIPVMEPPPRGWRGFDSNLNGTAEEVGRPSWLANLRGTLGRLLSATKSVRPPLDSTVLLRSGTALILIAVLIGGVLYLNRGAAISANELIARATEAQEQSIASTSQAVIYQNLQVRRKTSTASDLATWEIWNDVVSARTRQSIEQETGRHFIDVSQDSPHVPAAVSSLVRTLRANHMNPGLPLSAASFETWRRSLMARHDEVTRLAINGHEVVTLRTISDDQVSVGGIVEASLVVRASDWHPTGETLRVKGSATDEEFEMVETAYAVVSLNTLAPEIFGDRPKAAGATVTSSRNDAESENSNAASPSALRPAPVASADLEVEVLRLLHDARADLGEQISVAITPDGILHVKGMVDTSERKAEIIQALQPVAANAAVRIEVQTLSEAVAQQQQQSVRANATPAPVIQQNVDINNSEIAAAPELRRHFQTEDQVRDFAARIVSQSRSATRHAYALKRLAGQFSAEELRTLTPDAREKWLGLVRSHARAYQDQIASMSRELQPIFPGAVTSNADSTRMTDDSAILRSIEQLFAAASASDAAIRSAFATSSGKASSSSVSSLQFWESMKKAQALASHLGK